MYELSVTLIMRSNYNTHQIKHIVKLLFECNYTLTKHKAWQTSFNCSFVVLEGKKTNWNNMILIYSNYEINKVK